MHAYIHYTDYTYIYTTLLEVYMLPMLPPYILPARRSWKQLWLWGERSPTGAIIRIPINQPV